MIAVRNELLRAVADSVRQKQVPCCSLMEFRISEEYRNASSKYGSLHCSDGVQNRETERERMNRLNDSSHPFCPKNEQLPLSLSHSVFNILSIPSFTRTQSTL
jgi:hypothetical protein